MVVLPFGIAQAPTSMPSWKVIGSVFALGVVGLGVAYVIYFGLITGAGASRAILVTYLVPPMALFYGATILDEKVSANDLAGLALILFGVSLGTGVLQQRLRRAGRLRRQREAAREPALPATLLLLAAIWGASYLFIKVGVRDFQPATLMSLRLVIAFVPLFVFVAVTRGGAARGARARSVWRAGLVLGLLSAAVPFTLVAWGETHIDSGVAGVAQASLPLFTALLALKFKASERATGQRLVGIAVGLVGVGVLTGVDPGKGWWASRGHGAVLLSSLSYSAGGLFGQTRTATVSGPVLAAATTLFGASCSSLGSLRPAVAHARLEVDRVASHSRSPARRSRNCCSSTCCACTARRRSRSSRT